MASKKATQSNLIDRYIQALIDRNFVEIDALEAEIDKRGLNENTTFQNKLTRRIIKARKDAIDNYGAEVRNRAAQSRANEGFAQYDEPLGRRNPATEAENARLEEETRARAAKAQAQKQTTDEFIRGRQKQRYKKADAEYAPTEENPIPTRQNYKPEKQFANLDKKITPKKRIGSLKSVVPILGTAAAGYGIGKYMRDNAGDLRAQGEGMPAWANITNNIKADILDGLSYAPGMGSLATGTFGAGLYGRKKLLDMYDKYGTKDMGVREAMSKFGKDVTGASKDWWTRQGIEGRNWFPWLRDQEQYDKDIARLEERKQRRFGRRSDQRVEDYNKLVDEMAGKTADKPVVEEPAFKEAMRRQIDADIADVEAMRQRTFDEAQKTAEKDRYAKDTTAGQNYKKQTLQPDDVISVDSQGKAYVQDSVKPEYKGSRLGDFNEEIKARDEELKALRKLRDQVNTMTQADYDAKIAAGDPDDPLRRYINNNEGLFGQKNKVTGERVAGAAQDTAEDLLNKGKAAAEDVITKGKGKAEEFIDKGKEGFKKAREAVGLSKNIGTPNKPGMLRRAVDLTTAPVRLPVKGAMALTKGMTPLMASGLGWSVGEIGREIYDAPEGQRAQLAQGIASSLPGQIYDEVTQGVQNVQNIYESPEGGFIPAAGYAFDKAIAQPTEYALKSLYNAYLTGVDKTGELFMDENTWRPEYLNMKAPGFVKGAPQKYRLNEQTGKVEEIPEGTFSNNWARDYDMAGMHSALANTRDKVVQANKDYFASRDKPVPPGVVDELMDKSKQPAGGNGQGGGVPQQAPAPVPGQQYDGVTFKNMYGNTPVYQTVDTIEGRKVTSFSDTPAGAKYGAGQITADQMGADPMYQARAKQVNDMRTAQAAAARQQALEELKIRQGKGTDTQEWGKDYMAIPQIEDPNVRAATLQMKMQTANTPAQMNEAVNQNRAELARSYTPDVGFLGSLAGMFNGGISPLEYAFSNYSAPHAMSAIQQGIGTYDPNSQQYTVYDKQGKPDYDFKLPYMLAKDSFEPTR